MSETFHTSASSHATPAKWGQTSNLISTMKSAAAKPISVSTPSTPLAPDNDKWVRNQKVPEPNNNTLKKKNKGVMLFSTARY